MGAIETSFDRKSSFRCYFFNKKAIFLAPFSSQEVYSETAHECVTSEVELLHHLRQTIRAFFPWFFLRRYASNDQLSTYVPTTKTVSVRRNHKLTVNSVNFTLFNGQFLSRNYRNHGRRGGIIIISVFHCFNTLLNSCFLLLIFAVQWNRSGLQMRQVPRVKSTVVGPMWRQSVE